MGDPSRVWMGEVSGKGILVEDKNFQVILACAAIF
jgi:hypothetical protein